MSVIKVNRGTQAPAGQTIKSMPGGEVFRFTSAKAAKNTAPYIRIESKENKAMNLETFKVVVFDNTDTGVIVDAELTIKA